MNKLLFYILLNLLLAVSLEVEAQSNDNFKKLQEISLDQIPQKKSNSKISQRQNQQEISFISVKTSPAFYCRAFFCPEKPTKTCAMANLGL